MSELDPEILFAAALGATLARMRAELDECAIKRIMLFVLDRYGIDPRAAGDLYIRTLPAAPAAPATPPPELPPPTRQPIHAEVCPICKRTGINLKGLNMHMFRTHGTTMKEYQRQLALNSLEVDSA